MICSALRVEHELERADALHEARKAAKRVHYMCEVAVPAVGKPAKRLRRTMRKLQGMLGEHQDAAVARPTLHCLGLQADRHGHSAFTYGVLYAAEHFRARDVERALPTLVELLRAPDATNWLDTAPHTWPSCAREDRHVSARAGTPVPLGKSSPQVTPHGVASEIITW